MAGFGIAPETHLQEQRQRDPPYRRAAPFPGWVLACVKRGSCVCGTENSIPIYYKILDKMTTERKFLQLIKMSKS